MHALRSAFVLAGLASVALAQSSGSYLTQVSDDFNRPNAPTLGPDWIDMNVDGPYAVQNLMAVSQTVGGKWVQHATVSLDPKRAVVELDFLDPPGPVYAGVGAVLGSGASADFISGILYDFNNDNFFESVRFYGAWNSWSPWRLANSLTLATPTANGRMKLYLSNNGDTANLDVDVDSNGVYDEHFEHSGILAANMNLGTGVGFLTHHYGIADNWVVSDGYPPVTTYCSPKVNSLGCVPTIASSGFPNSTLASGFVVTGTQVRNQKSGILLYTSAGRASIPFGGGTLCVATPVQRSIPLNSGGTALPAADCTGVYSIDMNTFAQGLLGGSPAPELLIPGQTIDCQFGGRDPGFPAPNNISLTEGLEYTVG